MADTNNKVIHLDPQLSPEEQKLLKDMVAAATEGLLANQHKTTWLESWPGYLYTNLYRHTKLADCLYRVGYEKVDLHDLRKTGRCHLQLRGYATADHTEGPERD